MLSNINPQHAAIEEAVTAAWQHYVDADAQLVHSKDAWVTAVIELVTHVWDMRRLYRNDNAGFGEAFDALDLRQNGDRVSKQRRAALWHLGENIDKTREKLQAEKCPQSLRYLWERDIKPHAPPSAFHDDNELPVSEGSSLGREEPSTSGSDQIGSDEPPPTGFRAQVNWGIRLLNRGVSKSIVADRLGLNHPTRFWEMEQVYEHCRVEGWISAIDEGRCKAAVAKKYIHPNATTIYTEAEQQAHLDAFLAPSRRRPEGGGGRTRAQPAEPAEPATPPPRRRRGRPASGSTNTNRQPERLPPVHVPPTSTVPLVAIPQTPLVPREARSGLAAVTYITAEEAGLPPDATFSERGAFHREHGMHPTETILGRKLRLDREALVTVVTMLARFAETIERYPLDRLIDGIERMLAHTPRPDIGHGEQHNYAHQISETLGLIPPRIQIVKPYLQGLEAAVAGLPTNDEEAAE